MTLFYGQAFRHRRPLVIRNQLSPMDFQYKRSAMLSFDGYFDVTVVNLDKF